MDNPTEMGHTIYVYAARDSQGRLLYATSGERRDSSLDRAVWQVDGAEYPSQAVSAVLLHAADQYLGSDITVTRLIPPEPTNDEKLEDARRVLRADYWDDVRSVVSDIKDEIEKGALTDRDEVTEAIDERIDSHYRVTYTHAAIECLYFSDNDGAYEAEFGSEGMVEDGQIEWSRLAYFAMRQDVTDMLGDIDVLIEEHLPFPPNTERLHGDRYRDGGWEDEDGFPIPETTAPDCDRTCLPCQGEDHPSCGMGCHDDEKEGDDGE